MLELSDEILKELASFETFFQRIGFKRIDGAVYGLLVFSESPMSSEEIEETLGLSQSSISNSLKTLTHYGAIESRDSRDPEKRVKLHSAKEDSLSIVATVFRKREQESILEFKKMAERMMQLTAKDDSLLASKRAARLRSIISTCEMSEAVMNFVITLSQQNFPIEYNKVAKNLSRALEIVSHTTEPIGQLTGQLKQSFADKLRNGLDRLAGDS